MVQAMAMFSHEKARSPVHDRGEEGETMQSGTLDLAKVRHPWERVVLSLSVLANAALIAGVAAIAYLAPEWLSARHRVSALVDHIRLAAVATILLLPVLGFLRHGLWAAFRENSVRLGRDQVPEIFSILERHCRALGVDPPELYASTLEGVGPSTALRMLGGRRIIVLGPDLFTGLKRIEDRADALEFILGHELGRLELGHASWWEDIVLSYLKRIPILRAPLLTVQAASRDRFAATLSPNGLRGLVLLAVGGDLLDHVDAPTFVRQVMREDTPLAWAWMGQLGRERPHIAWRVRELYRAGFLHLERNLASGTENALAAEHD
jgi:hypothetical protein